MLEQVTLLADLHLGTENEEMRKPLAERTRQAHGGDPGPGRSDAEGPSPIDREKVDALSARTQALPIRDHRTPGEILGYDDSGIPR